MTEKKLGKISNVNFGYGGYNDACICLNFVLSGDGWGTSWFISGHLSPSIIEHSKYCKWTEEDRKQARSDLVVEIDKLLHQCKIENISQLNGKPVEVTFEDNTLKSWRILTEVL